MGSTTFSSSLFFLIGTYFANGAVHEWGYHHGVDPAHWKYLFSTCGGEQQSPIDIKTSKVKTDRRLGQFDFSKLTTERNVKINIQNNGHTVEVGLKGRGLKVSGGGLPGTYEVEQFHFHWGSKDTRGSEHEINGKHYSMEMHVVMHSDGYSSVTEAMNTTNGLAVLSFLFDIGRHNHNFDEIISHLHSIEHKGGHVQLNSFSMTSLFPSTDCFYRYYGSLTTPMCYESVIWTIFKHHIYISESQLNQFRHLGRTHFIGTGDLINNYRNPQPMNHRVVTSNCRRRSSCDSDSNDSSSDSSDSSNDSSDSSNDCDSDSDSDSDGISIIKVLHNLIDTEPLYAKRSESPNAKKLETKHAKKLDTSKNAKKPKTKRAKKVKAKSVKKSNTKSAKKTKTKIEKKPVINRPKKLETESVTMSTIRMIHVDSDSYSDSSSDSDSNSYSDSYSDSASDSASDSFIDDTWMYT
ncbi:carbonic anhydrase [Mytilus galloprovincialis]|uniref:Carbonic anhydrase n=1 Tax=Mytilus galloprovincialis TaxID=29158 RepID=A0A8B6EXI4_MYTGA|nr:carbonic anhydrase [Mytilus galloprovincialis]